MPEIEMLLNSMYHKLLFLLDFEKYKNLMLKSILQTIFVHEIVLPKPRLHFMIRPSLYSRLGLR